MSILITGGSGFVGLNMVERLLMRGESVVAYGKEQPSAPAMQYFQTLGGTFVSEIGDVCDAVRLREIMRKYGVRRVVHGAAITAGLERERTNPHSIIQVNLLGTLEVLEAACELGIERVIQLGTGSVYGSSVKTEGTLSPEHDTPQPDSLYGISKYAAERLAVRYRKTRNLDVSVARLGVVFGRWEYDTGVRDTLSIPYHLIRMAQQGVDARLAPVLPNDWVYAPDVAQAVQGLLEAPSLSFDVYQVGTGKAWSVQEWCELLAKQFPGFRYEFVADPQQANIGRVTPTPRAPFSIDRLRIDTGYKPEFEAVKALSDYLQWLGLNLQNRQ